MTIDIDVPVIVNRVDIEAGATLVVDKNIVADKDEEEPPAKKQQGASP